MAEPARRLDNDGQSGRTYDAPGTAPSSPKPDLKALEGGGEASPPKRGHLQETGTENPSREDLSSAEESSADAAGDAPASQHENQVGSGYRPSAPTSKKGFRTKLLGSRRRKVAFGGSLVVAAIAATIAIFLSLLPLKILHIVNNLQNRFYSTSQNALENETDHLLKNYVREQVLPSYAKCGTTVSKDCSVKVVSTNPVTNLYKSWGNARLENKLATDYGIEFQKKADGWYLKTPTTSSTGVNIGKTGEKIDSGFEKAGITDIRQAVKDETRWYQVYFRFKVGRLLEEKYGIRRCIIFCGVTDPLANKAADQKIAAKLFLTQRVLVPRTNTLGIALECLLSGCTGTDYQPTDATTGVNAAEAGYPEDAATDTAIRDGLTKLAASYGLTDSVTIDALVKTYEDMSAKGYTSYLISEGLAKLPFVSEDAAKGASDKIPYIGWIDLLSRMILAGNNAGSNIKKLSYVTNATAAVALFSMYRTYADEIKTGHANATEVGSLTDSLSPGNNGPASDPEIGGNVGAEGAPLYHSLIDGSSSSPISASNSSIADSILGSKVLAATTGTSSTTNSYKCNDGSTVPAGKLVCNEEVLGLGNHYADLLHEILNLPFINIFTQIAKLWHATIGQLFTWFNNVFGSLIQKLISAANLTCSLPFASDWSPYCTAKSLADKYLPQIEQAVVDWLIPNPFGSNMSGGRTFDMMAAGADVAGNDSAHTTLGGQQLSNQQVADIINQQQNEEFQNYKHEPFITRLFDRNSNYSPVSRLAMALPMSWGSATHSVISTFSNPFKNLGHAFNLMFSPKLAYAASSEPDPFGVVQYGYPAGSIPSDPETYWDKNCSNNAAYAYRKTNDWNIAASQNLDQNQMPLNTSVNPCLLIMATTGSDGGLFNSGLLTEDDLSNP